MTDPTTWPPPGAVPVETHISTVWLTPDAAYKAKKPVRLVFLDFTTLAAREHFCHEELRLNARTAPSLYRDVLPVTMGPDGPVLDGPGPVVDWVVRMQRFPDDALLRVLALHGRLTGQHIDRAAASIAAFHTALPPLPPSAALPKDLRAWATENVAEILELASRQGSVTPGAMRALGAELDAQFAALAPWFAQRAAAGWLRECHGDLHLGNLIAWQDDVVAFDAIDFDASLRIIDPVADAAFLFMDLLAVVGSEAAWRFVSGWAEALGDVDGLRALRPVAAYRALVRAKVALLQDDAAGFARYWSVAAGLVAPAPPARLVLTTGLSGSGKSTLAGALAEAMGALRLRSDVERKRLFGLASTARPADRAAVYGAEATQRTYARLEAMARTLLSAGHRVVVDAAALRQAERQRFASLAAAHGLPFALVECEVAPGELESRLVARASRGDDPSDADTAVLQRQRLVAEPVPHDWAAIHHLVHNDGDEAALQQAARRVATHLEAAP
jgi:uncharacterized protein